MSARLKVGALFLLLILAAQSFLTISKKSPTSDEFSHHIASGYSYWVTRDFRMNPVTPPLSRLLVSMPFLFLKVRAPLDHPSWTSGNSPEFARQFFYHNTRSLDELIFWARVPIVFLSVVFGIAVFFCAKFFFGARAALVSLALYSFCPTIVAFSSLAVSDLAVAFFYFLSVIGFAAYLRRPSWGRLGWTAIATGLTFLSKFTALLLFPTFVVMALLLGKTKALAPRRTLGFSVILLVTISAGYFFEIKPLLKNTPDPPKKIAFLRKIGGEPLVRWATDQPIPLATFTSAMGSFFFTRSAGTNAYLLGEWSTKGWWVYYFVAFFVKNTLPMVFFSAASFFFLKRFVADRSTAVVLTVPIVLFFIATLPDRAQAGIRYFLPVYPFLFILAGGLAAHWAKHNRFLKFFVLVLLFWHATESLRAFPNHLAYFNELAGGSPGGYRVLRDSNIDWGQDLKGLAKYAKLKGYPEVALYFLGPVDPGYYGLTARSFTPEEFASPKKGIYAVGVHGLDSVAWTRFKKPDATIGHSIWVYDFRRGVR